MRVSFRTAQQRHEALLETGQRPTINAPGEHQPPPEIPEVVGQHAQLQPDLVRSEPVTRQARPMRRLLAFLDPLLRRPAPVVKPHDGTILERKIRQNEADAREQLADVVLDFRHDPSGRGPALRLIPETLVPDQRPVDRSSRRTKQEVFDLDLQVLVCWHPDRVLDGTGLQSVVDLRFREGRVGASRLGDGPGTA